MSRRAAAVLTGLALALAACTSAGPGPNGGSARQAAPRRLDRTDREATEGDTRGDASSRQVLVVLPPGLPDHWAEVTSHLASVHGLTLVAAWEMKSLRELCAIFEVPSYTTPEALAERLARNPRVLMAQPNQRFLVQGAAAGAPPAPPGANAERSDTEPADPYLGLQHAAESLHLEEAHQLATGRGVTVALIDTGVDVDHPDLRGRVAEIGNFVTAGEESFTSDVHGTAVAGVVAATAGNGLGIMGVAPEARILALKACWHDPPSSRRAVCTSYTLAQALDFAIGSDARVLTLSLTGPDDPLLRRLVERALESGVVVVAAVDAEAADGGFPAHLDGVIAPWPARPEEGVGRPAEGDPGPAEALRAPAEEILTTIPRGAYDFFTGTSFAAAHAAGVAALVLQLRPHATAAQVRALLEQTARPTGTPPHLLDAAAAVQAAKAQGGQSNPPQGSMFPGPSTPVATPAPPGIPHAPQRLPCPAAIR